MDNSNSVRSLSGVLLSSIAVCFMVASIFESDERGMLFFDTPEAFAVSDVPSADRFPIVWGEQDYRRASRVIDARQRRGGGVGALPGEVAGTPQASVSGTVPGPVAALAPTNPLSAVQGNGPVGAGGGGNPLQSATPIGQGGGPIGLIPIPTATTPPVDPVGPTDPTDPVDPVVPAIPEPSSWLLMILGVGALGFALRSRRHLGSQVPLTGNV